MPSQSYARTPTPAPVSGPAPAWAPGRRSLLGNAELTQRLLQGSPARNEALSVLPSLRSQFPSLVGGGPDTARTEDLAAATDLTAADEVSNAEGGATTEDGITPVADADVKTPDIATPATPGANTTPTAPSPKVTPKAGTAAARIYAKHEGQVTGRTSTLTAAQLEDLQLFRANWTRNHGRYEAVARKTGVPAALVAALHWRESTGDFSTYLHQGDKLGQEAVHVPKDIPVFHVWEDAAVHALTMSDKAAVRDDLGMTADTRDAAAMATYAEFYNGLGYDMRKTASPYVYAGTDAYKKGKYVSDGRYSKNSKDQQLGVLTMVGAVGGSDTSIRAAPASGDTGWNSIVGGRTLRSGSSGALVKELQARLAKAGFPCGDDGKFGPTVERAVKAWQKAQGLPDDGIIGPESGKRLADPPAPEGADPKGARAAA